jgi:hypothetical protein
MDPTANLKEQIKHARRLLRCDERGVAQHGPGFDNCQCDPVRLAELVLALNEWLTRGGALPPQWESRR